MNINLKIYIIKKKIKSILVNLLSRFSTNSLFNTKNVYIHVVPGNLKYHAKTFPKFYNEKHEKMNIFYLNDTNSGPYGFVAGRTPSNIIWDRYNYTLDNRFFAHYSIYDFERVYKLYKSKKNFYIEFESESIVPELIHYDMLKYNNIKDFDAIFTPHKCILDKYSNSYFIPGGGVYIGTDFGGGEFNDEQYNKKIKLVSIVSSNKQSCRLHKERYDLAMRLKNNNKVDTFGTFDGGLQIKIADSLMDYMYSIVIENFVSPYYFTEKLLNCFATHTVPIYVGASDISKFFNIKGIIQVDENDINSIIDIVKELDYSDYIRRKEAIIDNYNRVKKYLCIEDYLYNNYNYLFSDLH